MSQPENWTDEERELLQSAELDAPAPNAQNRTLAALGIGGAALSGSVAVAGSAKAASLAAATPKAAVATTVSGGGKALLFGKLLAIVVAGGVVGGAALHYRSPASPPPAVAARAHQPAKAFEAARGTATPVAAPPNPAVAPEAAPSVSRASVAAPRAEPDITLEIEALDRARSAQGRGDFATALGELDRYDRTFKLGRLRPEALVLRIQTLLGKGDAAGAKALGSRFLARYPESPLSPRIQKLIGAGR
jgi:hypothetical protein